MNKSYQACTAALLFCAGAGWGQEAPPAATAPATRYVALTAGTASGQETTAAATAPGTRYVVLSADSAQTSPAAMAPGTRYVVLSDGSGSAPQPTPVPNPREEFSQPPPPVDTSCGDNPCFAGAGPAYHRLFTADLEYALWFISSSFDLKPLVTTDIVGAADEQVLESLADVERQNKIPGSGARIALGYWDVLDNPWIPGGIRDQGVEAVFFIVGQRSVSLMLDDTNPTLVRPFFDLNDRMESAFIVALPGLATGNITTNADLSIWGAEANCWKNVGFNYPGTSWTVDLMAGLRYLDLDERLDIFSTSVFNQNLAAFPTFKPLAGDTLQVFDSFVTNNHFYGGQVGISSKFWFMDSAFLECGAKVAVGDNNEDLQIAGRQILTPPNGASVTSRGGLLALPSNIGDFHRDEFAQVLELDLKVSAVVTNHLTLSTGFSALYWSKVLRPGEQIERGLDISQIPNFPPGATATPTGLHEPNVPFQQSDLWVLGITFGLELKY